MVSFVFAPSNQVQPRNGSGPRRHPLRRHLTRVGGIVIALMLGFFAVGVRDSSAQELPAKASTPPQAAETKPLPPRRDLQLITKDGVLIHCSYFGSNRGREAIPIILIHGWSGPLGAGSRRDLLPLAEELQQAGHAVVVTDLRGHGDSVERELANESTVKLDRDKFRPGDLRDMALDIEATRSFLVEENNAGRLNLNLLCVVGFELGSIVALNWIDYDWSVPSFPTLKQGQDVKGFVLVSPEQTWKGLTARSALANDAVRSDLSAMIIVGQGDPSAASGRRIHNTLKRSHRPVPANPQDAERFQDLFLVELDTSLSGTRLLEPAALQVPDRIAEFVKRRLSSQQDVYPWRDRSVVK